MASAQGHGLFPGATGGPSSSSSGHAPANSLLAGFPTLHRSHASNAQEKRSALVALQTSQATWIARFVSELKSRSEETRVSAARELFHYVSAEMREVPAEELNAFLDLFTKQILEMVQGDAHAKMGGILAIVALINADVCNTGDRISRFGNYLRNNCLSAQPSGGSSSSQSAAVLSPEDFSVIELASKAIARLTQVSSGTYTANLKFELIDHEVKRAFEVLQGEKSEGKRYAAVLILREIAFSMPTFFFQNVSQFFGVIYHAVWDSKLKLRESAVNALRAGLVVTAQRETSRQNRDQHLTWYTHCYDKTIKGFESIDGEKKNVKEDAIHGSLLSLSELLRCSNAEWERVNRDVEDYILCENATQHNANIIHARPGAIGSDVGGSNGTGGSGLSAVRRYCQAGLKL